MSTDKYSAHIITLQNGSGKSRIISHLSSSFETALKDADAPMRTGYLTIIGGNISENAKVAEPSAIGSALYPQVFDENERSGLALRHFRAAFEIAKTLPDLILEPDLPAVDSSLTKIGALVALAYPHTDFNSALGPLTSFIRRSALFTDRDSIDFAALVQLSKALENIVNDPMMDFDTATDISIYLETHGWQGDNSALLELAREVLNDPQISDEIKDVVKSE